MIEASRTDSGGSKPDEKLDRLLSRFAVAARAHHAALESMDAERAGCLVRMIDGLHEALLREGENGVEKLLELLESIDPVVAGMAAVYAIRLDSRRCLATLNRVATESGLLGFRADMAILRWETGDWGE